METIEIQKRYNDLAESTCCLSCGGSLDYSNPQTDEVCIDLGSGRGTDVIRMAQTVGKGGFVYGIDISESMIKKAVQTAEKLGIQNISFIRSDLEKIKLDSEIANLIISNCTINHAIDKQFVWNEIYRLLKPAGRFVISDIYSMDNVPDEYKNDPIAVAECWAGAVTKEEYFKIIKNSGFKKINILEESKPYKKEKIEVASFTISGKKPKKCNCSN